LDAEGKSGAAGLTAPKTKYFFEEMRSKIQSVVLSCKKANLDEKHPEFAS
jgi:hypothetical protein